MLEKFITIIFITITTVHRTNAVKIDCEMNKNDWVPFGILTECLTSKVISTEPNTKVSKVNSNVDLNEFKSFYIDKSPNCHYLPTDITKYLKNIQVLVIASTGLKSITKDDLQPFEKLRGLYIDQSHLTTIDGDLFRYVPNIEELSLKDNQINFVEVDIFKPLHKLTTFYFDLNVCMSSRGKGRENVEKLIKEIEVKCQNHRSAGDAATEMKVNQQEGQKADKGSTTERNSFLA